MSARALPTKREVVALLQRTITASRNNWWHTPDDIRCLEMALLIVKEWKPPAAARRKENDEQT